jgi:hypothetical protein
MKIFPPISLFYNVSMGKIEITLWHTIIGLWDSLGLHFILLGIRGSLKFSKHGCSVFFKKKINIHSMFHKNTNIGYANVDSKRWLW